FPAHAIAAAKANVLRAETMVTEHLLAEGAAFDATLGEESAQTAMRAFLAAGGQTPDGERRLGDLVGELGRAAPDAD
ncbi:MAG: enoyl-CoA hydratase/isomerase family protein, partial [Actinomycetota bacterium]